jgi:hypothetical protein
MASAGNKMTPQMAISTEWIWPVWEEGKLNVSPTTSEELGGSLIYPVFLKLGVLTSTSESP